MSMFSFQPTKPNETTESIWKVRPSPGGAVATTGAVTVKAPALPFCKKIVLKRVVDNSCVLFAQRN